MTIYTVLYEDNQSRVGAQYPIGNETAVIRLLSVLIRSGDFKSFSVVMTEEIAEERS